MTGPEETEHAITLAHLSNAEKEAVWRFREAEKAGYLWTHKGERGVIVAATELAGAGFGR